MPMRLDEGWNQIQFNLGDFTSRAYNTVYIETLRVQIHASCRIRRIFFSSRLYEEDELPPQFKIWMPSKAPKESHMHQNKPIGKEEYDVDEQMQGMPVEDDQNYEQMEDPDNGDVAEQQIAEDGAHEQEGGEGVANDQPAE